MTPGLQAVHWLTSAILVVGLDGVAWGQPYDEAPASLGIMTWNVEWMFDHELVDNRSSLARSQTAPSLAYWEAKREGVVEVLARYQPEIVALQEIEGAQTLKAIVDRLKAKHAISYGYAFIQGHDRFTEQDVGLLFRNGLVCYSRQEQSKRMLYSGKYYNLSKHLFAEFRWDKVTSPLTMLNVHLRATGEAEDIRVKQARLARHWLETPLNSGQDAILLGDLNTEYLVVPTIDAIAGSDIAQIVGGQGGPTMVDVLAHLPNPSQATHSFLEKQFDRIFVSESLMEDGPGQDWSFAKIEVLSDSIVRGDRDGIKHWSQRLRLPVEEFDLSDHYPVLVTFELR